MGDEAFNKLLVYKKTRPYRFYYLVGTALYFFVLMQYIPNDLIWEKWAHSLVRFMAMLVFQVDNAYEQWQSGNAIGMMPVFYSLVWIHLLVVTPIAAYLGRHEQVADCSPDGHVENVACRMGLGFFPIFMVIGYFMGYALASRLDTEVPIKTYNHRGIVPLFSMLNAYMHYLFYTILYNVVRIKRNRRKEINKKKRTVVL